MFIKQKQSLGIVVADIDFFFSHRFELAKKLSEKYQILVISDLREADMSKLAKHSFIKFVQLKSRARINKFININVSYSTGKYIFKEFVDNGSNFSGNNIPGIPNDILTLSLEYKTKNELLLNLNFKSIGDIYANNSNTVVINDSNTLNIKIGKEFQLSKTSIYPFFIINNIFENNYYDNIRINAFGGRYYEPAPKRTIFGGIKFTL